MTADSEITKLDDWEDEDISDLIIKLEKSFGLRFDKKAFANVKTFGDLIEVFENHITYSHREDCTKQQAFYRIRTAISKTQLIDENDIQLDSELSFLFPNQNRRQKVREFQRLLGTDASILTYPDWLIPIFVIGFILSLVAFSFDWKIALSGIAFFILATKIASKLGKDLSVKTVRELAEKLTREKYIDIRRIKGSVNKNEIMETIRDTFSHDLDIDRKYLTRDAKFSWA